jgi:hypothetical protein
MSISYVEVTQTPPLNIDVEIGNLAEETYVGPTAPTFTSTGIWIQTGLGPGGTDYTIWFEDGQ